jgi:hypothetical protein
MHEARNSSPRADDARRGPDSALPPAKAFLLVLALMVVAGVVLILTTRDDPPSSAAEQTPKSSDFALTNEEAIQRFRDLSRLALKATRQRNLSLISHVYTQYGPMSQRASRIIKNQLHDRILEKTKFETIDLEVITNESDRIQLREVSLMYPCFVTESGRDVTKGPSVIERQILWTLKQEGNTWQLHDASLEEDRLVERHRDECT